MTGMSRMRPRMATHSSTPASRLKSRMLTRMKMTRNSVPQRGWAVGKRRTFSTVRGSSASSAWMVMCSAPWYWKTRPISCERLTRSR